MGHSKKIIIIDDDAGMGRLYKTILELENYEVKTFWRGEDGIEFIAKVGPPDMLLLDCSMPAMSGEDFLDRLEERGLRSDAYPVVGFSSFPKDLPFIARFVSRVNAYIEKPETVDEMLEVMGRFFEQK